MFDVPECSTNKDTARLMFSGWQTYHNLWGNYKYYDTDFTVEALGFSRDHFEG